VNVAGFDVGVAMLTKPNGATLQSVLLTQAGTLFAWKVAVEQIGVTALNVNVGLGLIIDTLTCVALFAKPAPQLFTGLILITPFVPFVKSDVTVTLVPPAYQLLPVDVNVVPTFQLIGN